MNGIPIEQFTWIVVAVAVLGLGCVFFVARSKPKKVDSGAKPTKIKSKTATIIVKDEPKQDIEVELPSNAYLDPEERLKAYREILFLTMLDEIVKERLDREDK